ncbi:MAG: hypothetical protein LC620_08675 [Halobacteriales archaeon]|nr:hypothetical protein [Halobacteriales archaeon]
MSLPLFDPIPPPGLDEVQVAFATRLDPAHHGPQGTVAHAFVLDLDHRRLLMEELFEASEMFDFHEVAADDRHLVVDVLEVTPTRTSLHVQPDRAMTYCAIAREIAAMLEAVGARVFGGTLQPARLHWIVEPMGVPSPLPRAAVPA